MALSREGAWRIAVPVTLLAMWALVGVGPRSAQADVAAVRGSAFGYFADDVRLFGGLQPDVGPRPAVTLPSSGSSAPVTAGEATGLVRFGPATLFSSGTITVSTQGSTGASGSVTTTASVANINTSGDEVFTAANLSSTCTAGEGAASGSTTVTGGRLVLQDPNPDTSGETGEVVVNVPVNPAPNTTYRGTVATVNDSFEYIFNERIANADGSLTVNAAHMRLLGPAATGDLIIGQSICGVTATTPTTTTASSPTTSATTSTTTSDTTSTTAPLATSTTAAPTTTATTSVSGATVGGGAFGYFTRVGLFGGSPADRGPAPTVTLPASGSAAPITDSAPTGDARYGPGIIFTSGPITVSTQGVPGPTGSVTSSSDIGQVNTSDQEVLSATRVTSTCTASGTGGASGSATIAGGRLRTSDGDPDRDGDETFVDIPASPAPNTSIEGKIESINDTYRYVFNEQIKQADGSIIVNAAHQYLLGPTAVGELIIGQSRCAMSATAFSGNVAGGATGQSPPGLRSAGSPTGPLAATGAPRRRLAPVGLALVVGGALLSGLGRRRLIRPGQRAG